MINNDILLQNIINCLLKFKIATVHKWYVYLFSYLINILDL